MSTGLKVRGGGGGGGGEGGGEGKMDPVRIFLLLKINIAL